MSGAERRGHRQKGINFPKQYGLSLTDWITEDPSLELKDNPVRFYFLFLFFLNHLGLIFKAFF